MNKQRAETSQRAATTSLIQEAKQATIGRYHNALLAMAAASVQNVNKMSNNATNGKEEKSR